MFACVPGVPLLTKAEAPLPLPKARLAEAIRQGFQLLDRLFWSPEWSIWLDRAGNDLRACYEGRLNPPWWSCANAVETLTDYMKRTGSQEWLEALKSLHARHRDNPDHAPLLIAALEKRGEWTPQDAERRRTRPRPRFSTKPGFRDFNNEYLDDSGWWGLAWLKLHGLTGEPAFLETAVAIHRHMDAHRMPDGGIIWNLENQPPVTNAISNSLFLTLSARLCLVTGKEEYLAKARRTRQWFIDQKLYDGTGIVDGPGHVGDYWSYNQGMWILSLLALAEADKEPALVDKAAAFTRTLLEKGGFLREGVLMEKLSQTGWDTALFKGVLARALGQLRDTLRRQARQPETAALVDKVLQASAASLLANPRDAQGLVGLQWQPKAEKQEYNFNTQLAGLMGLTAALEP
jgi:predicted alpha-1,6-mannanase (GH76 family)